MQYGGRKHRKANDPEMINEMILDLHRMSYKQITIVQQDLASCFDRTIQNITNIFNPKFHIPIEVCRLNTKIKQDMKFHITLSQGTSKKNLYKQQRYANTRFIARLRKF